MEHLADGTSSVITTKSLLKKWQLCISHLMCIQPINIYFVHYWAAKIYNTFRKILTFLSILIKLKNLNLNFKLKSFLIKTLILIQYSAKFLKSEKLFISQNEVRALQEVVRAGIQVLFLIHMPWLDNSVLYSDCSPFLHGIKPLLMWKIRYCDIRNRVHKSTFFSSPFH